MILQTGQRTDIPAFYGQWLINRIEAGFVDVRNPYNPTIVSRYPINSKVVDGIAFCTKNPIPFIPLLPRLSKYRQYWHITITPYDRDIEPYVPPYNDVIVAFKHISDSLNPQSIVWRYNPIIINHKYSIDAHYESFHSMAKSLAGYTDTVIVSFLDIFDKVLANFPTAQRPPKDVQTTVIRELVKIAKSFGMILKTCGEGDIFKNVGAYTNGCLTVDCYERAWGLKLNVPKRNPARPECACYLHNDIGAYDTCSHFCRYCYANTNQDAVRRNRALHDPNSTMLIGHVGPHDTIKVQNTTSWVVPYQEILF